MEPSGRIRPLTRKSSMSRMPFPAICTSDHTLKPSAQGMLPRNTKGRRMRTVFFLLQPKSSMQLPMRLSKTAVTVEKLANVMKTKKRDPQNCPKDMLMNTFGSVTKMRDGPSDGSTPNAEHAGKMMRPAIRATNVSSAVILTASPPRVLLRLM